MDGSYSLKLVGGDAVGNQWNNVLHYIVTGTGPQAAIDTGFDVINAWVDQDSSQYLACLPDDVYLGYLASRLVTAPGQPTAVKSVVPNMPGTRPTSLSALAIGPQLNLYSDVGGARVGKIYLPGIATGDVDDGRISVSLNAALDDLEDALLTTLTLAGGGAGHLAIFSRATSTGFVATTIIRAPKLAVLGRRLRPVI